MLNRDYNGIAAYGFVDENGFCVLEGSENGFCYKNPYDYFTNPDEICYVPEFYYLNMPEYVATNETGDNLLEDIKQCAAGWTANDILKICDNNRYVADIVFDLIDWQSPEIKYLEVLEEVDEGDYDYGTIYKNIKTNHK